MCAHMGCRGRENAHAHLSPQPDRSPRNTARSADTTPFPARVSSSCSLSLHVSTTLRGELGGSGDASGREGGEPGTTCAIGGIAVGVGAAAVEQGTDVAQEALLCCKSS